MGTAHKERTALPQRPEREANVRRGGGGSYQRCRVGENSAGENRKLGTLQVGAFVKKRERGNNREQRD